MILIENGYVQDGLKAIIYIIPLIYLIVKRKSLNLKHFGLFLVGLSLLAFGNILDFIDEIEFLTKLPLADQYGPLQDFFEDIVGLALGFLVLSIAMYKEFKHKR